MGYQKSMWCTYLHLIWPIHIFLVCLAESLFSFKRLLSSKGNTRKLMQKQPSRSVLRKRCSENMQQINRGTSMPLWDFNKVAKKLYWNHTLEWVFSCIFAAYLQNTFSEEHLWMAASAFPDKIFILTLLLASICSKTTMETTKQCVKSVQS